MTSSPSLADKIVAIHRSLDAARIPHAFGGALALAYYAEPRATVDIDVNIFLPPADHPRVIEALASLGVDPDVDVGSLERDGQGRLWWDSNPIDLFFAYDLIHARMQEQSRLAPFGDQRVSILSPEHVLVCKVVYDRPKDWLDIEQILVTQPDLDRTEIERQLDRLTGPSDPRAGRFAELAARWDEPECQL